MSETNKTNVLVRITALSNRDAYSGDGKENVIGATGYLGDDICKSPVMAKRHGWKGGSFYPETMPTAMWRNTGTKFFIAFKYEVIKQGETK